MDEHIEDRPTWRCRACGQPWPCLPARLQLLAELSPTRLRIHMWIRLECAAQDMPATPVREFFDRFLGWTGDLERRGNSRRLTPGGPPPSGG